MLVAGGKVGGYPKSRYLKFYISNVNTISNLNLNLNLNLNAIATAIAIANHKVFTATSRHRHCHCQSQGFYRHQLPLPLPLPRVFFFYRHQSPLPLPFPISFGLPTAKPIKRPLLSGLFSYFSSLRLSPSSKGSIKRCFSVTFT